MAYHKYSHNNKTLACEYKQVLARLCEGETLNSCAQHRSILIAAYCKNSSTMPLIFIWLCDVDSFEFEDEFLCRRLLTCELGEFFQINSFVCLHKKKL